MILSSYILWDLNGLFCPQMIKAPYKNYIKVHQCHAFLVVQLEIGMQLFNCIFQLTIDFQGVIFVNQFCKPCPRANGHCSTCQLPGQSSCRQTLQEEGPDFEWTVLVRYTFLPLQTMKSPIKHNFSSFQYAYMPNYCVFQVTIT